MRYALAVVLGSWATWRWLATLVGLARMRRLRGDVRREARRAVVTRVAWNVFWSVAALYAWAAALRVQPTEAFVGFIAFVLVASLVVAVLSGFMQPAERSPESLDLFALRRRRPSASSDRVATPSDHGDGDA